MLEKQKLILRWQILANFLMEVVGEHGSSKAASAADSEQRKPFVLKKWNAIATWSWDVECDSCAICRVHLMG